MANDEIRGGALYIYGASDFRYGVEDNGDIPGQVNLIYDEWDTETREWKTKLTFECLSAEQVIALGEAARIITKWETNELFPSAVTITLRDNSVGGPVVQP